MKNEPNSYRRVLNGGLDWIHPLFVIGITATTVYNELWHGDDMRVRFTYWLVVVYFCLLSVGFGWFVYQSGRKSRYAEAMVCIQAAVHAARDATWQLSRAIEHGAPYSESEFLKTVQCVLNATANAYGIVTGTRNRACIKILGPATGSMYLKTFARDGISAMQCAEQDGQEGERHTVLGNTDFQVVLVDGHRYFLHNNLAKAARGGLYRNTSSAVAKEPPKNYMATIVFPIRFMVTAPHKEGVQEQPPEAIYGVLAIDARARGSYSERYDVDMGMIVADALFSLFHQWEMIKRIRTEPPR